MLIQGAIPDSFSIYHHCMAVPKTKYRWRSTQASEK